MLKRVLLLSLFLVLASCSGGSSADPTQTFTETNTDSGGSSSPATTTPSVSSFTCNSGTTVIDGTTSINCSITFSQAIDASTISSSDFSFSNTSITDPTIGTPVDTGDSTTFTIPITGIADNEEGSLVVVLAANSIANSDPTTGPSSSSSSSSITIDTLEASVTTISCPAGVHLNGTTSISCSISFSEQIDSTSLTSGDFTLNTGSVTGSGIGAITSSGDITFTVPVTIPNDSTGSFILNFNGSVTDSNTNSGSDNESSIGVAIDTDEPDAVTGMTLGSNFVTSGSSSPLISWTNPSDGDFSHAQVTLGTTSGGSETVAYENAGSASSHTFSSVSFSNCTTYYPTTRALDTNGNISSEETHLTGFTYDDSNPTAIGSLDVSTTTAAPAKSPIIDWSSSAGSDNCGIDHYEMAIGYDDDGDGFDSGDIGNKIAYTEIPGGNAVTSYQMQDGVDSMSVSLDLSVTYYVHVRVVDAAGNTSSGVTGSSFTISVSDPSDIPGNYFWLDGADMSTLYKDVACSDPVTSDADAVLCWENKGTNGSNFIRDTGSAVYVGTGKTGVHFSGDIFVASGVFSGAIDDVMIMIVQKEVSRTNSFDFNLNHPYTGSTPGGATTRYSTHFPWGNGNIYWDAGGCCSSPERQYVASGLNVGQTHMIAVENSSSNGRKQIIRDGNVLITSGTATSGIAGDFSMGSSVNNVYHEVIFYTPAPSDAEREIIEGSLACKWDIRDQLPIAHPYYHATGSDDTGCP